MPHPLELLGIAQNLLLGKKGYFGDLSDELTQAI
jgi:hypothetical protein